MWGLRNIPKLIGFQGIRQSFMTLRNPLSPRCSAAHAALPVLLAAACVCVIAGCAGSTLRPADAQDPPAKPATAALPMPVMAALRDFIQLGTELAVSFCRRKF